MIMNTLKTILLAAVVGLLAGAGARAADNPALTGTVKSVYDHYLKIQASLANDSLAGVVENANAITKAVQGDTKTLPAEVGTQAKALAQAKDLPTARGRIQAVERRAHQIPGRQQSQGRLCANLLPNGEGQLVAGGKNVKESILGTSHVRVRGNSKLNGR